MARLIGEVYAGRLSPNISAGPAPPLNIQLRAVEITDTEEGLGQIEDRLSAIEAERKSKGAKAHG